MHKLTTLEAGRGIAALLVVACHATALISLSTNPPNTFFKFGYSGVDFFFVLSGFIITFVHFKDFGHPERFLAYARKRFIRIYPPYWAVILLLAPVFLLAPSLTQSYKRDPWFILGSLLLVPQPRVPVLPVSWTLVYEMFFYTLLGIMIVSRRLGIGIVALWVLFLGVCQFMSFDFPLSFLSQPRALEFLLGVGVATLTCTTSGPGKIPALLLMTLGTLSFLVTGILESFNPPKYWPLLYGLSATAFVAGAVALEREGRLKAGNWFVLLGAASYSIYLTHYPLLVGEAIMMSKMKLFDVFNANLLVAFGICLTAGIGILFHLYIEKPVSGFVSSKLR